MVLIVEASIMLLLILAGILVLFILFQRLLTLMRTQANIISSITHEFKTPLATTQLYLETLKKRQLPEETRVELVDGMLAENQRLKNLVENFLESVRAANKRRPYRLRRTRLAAFIDQFIERHASLLNGAGIRLEIDPELEVNLDQRSFDMVLSNLCVNAMQYSLGPAEIVIQAWSKRNKVFIRFSDAGIGIPKRQRREIFKMFKRLPEGMSLMNSGTGMGLYVVRSIIRGHGGSIALDVSHQGPGASFIIKLPAVKHEH
ncbi:MAG: Signal-transduction histidine kinase senX3 [Deltaproteobacteria bacterium ADurb.Bin510]|nr:MAG: Signal-transduction histidine kinase senX3 [Deltaproteobacteria bacterium ADurb.Bin510]